jgi:hypothetical protein
MEGEEVRHLAALKVLDLDVLAGVNLVRLRVRRPDSGLRPRYLLGLHGHRA